MQTEELIGEINSYLIGHNSTIIVLDIIRQKEKIYFKVDFCYEDYELEEFSLNYTELKNKLDLLIKTTIRENPKFASLKNKNIIIKGLVPKKKGLISLMP